MGKTLFSHPALFRVFGPRTRTQGRDEAPCGKKRRVGETEGCASEEALQRRCAMRRQVTHFDNRLQSPFPHHEGDKSGVRYKQGRIYG